MDSGPRSNWLSHIARQGRNIAWQGRRIAQQGRHIARQGRDIARQGRNITTEVHTRQVHTGGGSETALVNSETAFLAALLVAIFVRVSWTRKMLHPPLRLCS